jgi:ferredoxin--NADP+ reductase
MNSLSAGDALQNVAGPLGKPSEIESFGSVVVVGGGVGTAIAWPTARALKQAGNEVIAIVGARSKELLILEQEMREASGTLHLLTDDGSCGEKGFVTAKLAGLYASGLRPGLVLAIGPVPMMRAVAELTRPFGTRTVVSLNAIMVDGTGMCGGCRVIVGGESRFACVDGPEFDAHSVDFDVLSQRNAMYREAERHSLELFEQSNRAARKAEAEASCCEARA